MKAVILAGGRGTRLSEETTVRPKPMVEIGGKPLLWHIMNIYASHGVKDFLVACGYKAELVKEYFHNFFIHNSDYFVDLKDGKRKTIGSQAPDWNVGIIDTGLDTQTGGRLWRLRSWLKDGTFMATYGDGVGNIDVEALLAFHKKHKKIATVTAVHPPSRFGALNVEGDQVVSFTEKPQIGEGWINGGFFVFEPKLFGYLSGEGDLLEREPLERLSNDGQLMAYRHEGFWQPMDTIREKQLLENLWASGRAPWKSWK